MAAYRRDRTPGVYVRHEQGCPAENADGPRCKCDPSYRGKTRSHGWSRTFKERTEAEGWKLDVKRGLVPLPVKDAQPVEGLTFRAIAEQWWQAVENSEIGTRRSRRPYSPNTLHMYRIHLDAHSLPVMGGRLAADLDLTDWQKFTDGLHAKGLKSTSINAVLNPVRCVYGWACSPRRKILPVNAIIGVELPPADAPRPRRLAEPAEAARLLAALSDDDQVIWGLAFYAGWRSSEIGGDRRKDTPGADWKYVDFERGGLFVLDSKSEAGVRWTPMVKPLRTILLTAWNRQGRPSEGRVVVGTISGAKSRALGRMVDGEHVPGVWEKKGMEPIGLHACRHTFVSYMAAAGVPSKLRSEIAGHEDEKMTRHYTHTLPAQIVEAGSMLDNYLEQSA